MESHECLLNAIKIFSNFISAKWKKVLERDSAFHVADIRPQSHRLAATVYNMFFYHIFWPLKGIAFMTAYNWAAYVYLLC